MDSKVLKELIKIADALDKKGFPKQSDMIMQIACEMGKCSCGCGPDCDCEPTCGCGCNADEPKKK